MKTKQLKKKEIYGIGDKVLSAARLPDEEIESIVNAPHLFRRIRAAAEAEKAGSGYVRASFFVFLRRNALAGMAAILLVGGGIWAVNVGRQYYERAFAATDVPEPKIPGMTPQVNPTVPEAVASDIIPAGLDRAVAPKHNREIARNVKKPSKATPTAPQTKEVEMGEFQALSYAGGPDEMIEQGGKIVRVELSRASLYAMGVDVPLENESGKLKADLLIGFDGVMKGVRVEKRD